MKKISVVIVFIVSAFSSVEAQDIHFTQWFHAPHTYNPAEVGNFSGDHRFHANHRNQWSSVTVPFQTFAIMADSKALTKNRNLALGTNIIYDVTGDSKFTTTGFSGTAVYSIDLPGDSLGNFSVGIQPSFTQKKLDLTQLNFDNQFNGNFFNPDLPVNENLQRLSRWYFDLAIGVRGFFALNKKDNLEVGLSLYNLLKPKQSFFNEDDIRLDRRGNVMLKLNHQLNPKLLIQPGVLFSQQGAFTSFNIGANLYYDLSESKYLTKKVFAGLYGRTKDSGDLIAGLIYNNWTFAGSYDFNFSTLVPASNYRGGFELAVIYVLRKAVKRPTYKSCPPYL